MVLGRGKEGGLARYRAVMSFRLCNQGVRWKPHTEGAPAAAGHFISYSVRQSQSFFHYGDGSGFLWLSSGERCWLTPRPHWENTCAFTFWNHIRLNKMLALYLSLRVWEQLRGGRQLSLAPPRHPHHTIPVVYQVEEKSKCPVLLKIVSLPISVPASSTSPFTFYI